MDRRQIGLKLVMDALRLKVKVDSFDHRLILQKAVYLAEASGVRLGYYYRWYLRGPYCPAVTDDGFAVAAELSGGMDDAKSWDLDSASVAKLARVRRLIAGAPRTDLARKLELLASVHYLVDRRQVPGRDPKTITRALHKFNKLFGEPEVAAAMQEMAADGILP